MVLSSAAESEFVAQHTPLVHHLAKRYTACGVSREDLLQEGFIGLLEAIRTYDSEKQRKLSSWIVLVVSHSMFHAVQAAGRHSMQRLDDQAEVIVDFIGDQADDGDLWDALELVRQDLGRKRARLFIAWLGFGSQEPLVLMSLCKRYQVDIPQVLAIIGLGIRSCRDRLGLDSRLDNVRIGKSRYDLMSEFSCLN